MGRRESKARDFKEQKTLEAKTLKKGLNEWRSKVKENSRKKKQ
jgi:hypothetical protein